MRFLAAMLIASMSILLSPGAHAASLPPDIVVAADGSGDFRSVQEAVRMIPKGNR